MDEKMLERLVVALERIANALEPSAEGEPLTVADNLEFVAGALQTEDGTDLADVLAGVLDAIEKEEKTG